MVGKLFAHIIFILYFCKYEREGKKDINSYNYLVIINKRIRTIIVYI